MTADVAPSTAASYERAWARLEAAVLVVDEVGPEIRAVLAGFARQAVGRGRGQARGLRWNDIDRIVDTVAE